MLLFVIVLLVVSWLGIGYASARAIAMYFEAEYGEGSVPTGLCFFATFSGLCGLIPALFDHDTRQYLFRDTLNRRYAEDARYIISQPRTSVQSLFLTGVTNLPVHTTPHKYSWEA